MGQGDWAFAVLTVLFAVFVVVVFSRAPEPCPAADARPTAGRFTADTPPPVPARGAVYEEPAPPELRWSESVTPAYVSRDWRPELSPHGPHNPLPAEVGVALGPIGFEGDHGHTEADRALYHEGGNGGAVAWEDLSRTSGVPQRSVNYRANWEESHEPLVGATTPGY